MAEQKKRIGKKSSGERRSSRGVSLTGVQQTLFGKGPHIAEMKRMDARIAKTPGGRARKVATQ